MKKQQRSEAKAECASSAKRNAKLKYIDFSKCERNVKKAANPNSKGSKRKEVQQGESLAAFSCHFIRSQSIGGEESDFQ